MEEIKLNKSGVEFIEETHEYFLGDKQLMGITGTLIQKAFPNTYDNIPESVLKKAAERGSIVHQTFELFHTVLNSDLDQWTENFGTPIPELEALNAMLISYGLHHVDSEYMVTDEENFASAIDGVYGDDEGNIYIADYKTTSKLYYDHVSLQLSIYARWFERQNPHLKVKKLVCMWFHGGKHKFQALPRVSGEKIDELIRAYMEEDENYRYTVDVPQEFSELEQTYLLLDARINALTMQQDEVKASLMKLMEQGNHKKIETEYGTYNFMPAGQSKRFDSKAFKEANEEEYNKYIKVSETKPSIRIKLN